MAVTCAKSGLLLTTPCLILPHAVVHVHLKVPEIHQSGTSGKKPAWCHSHHVLHALTIQYQIDASATMAAGLAETVTTTALLQMWLWMAKLYTAAGRSYSHLRPLRSLLAQKSHQ